MEKQSGKSRWAHGVIGTLRHDAEAKNGLSTDVLGIIRKKEDVHILVEGLMDTF